MKILLLSSCLFFSACWLHSPVADWLLPHVRYMAVGGFGLTSSQLCHQRGKSFLPDPVEKSPGKEFCPLLSGSLLARWGGGIVIVPAWVWSPPLGNYCGWECSTISSSTGCWECEVIISFPKRRKRFTSHEKISVAIQSMWSPLYTLFEHLLPSLHSPSYTVLKSNLP